MYFTLKKEMGEQVPPSEKVRFEKFNTHEEYVKHMQDSVVSPLLTVQGSLLQATIAADVSSLALGISGLQLLSDEVIHGSHQNVEPLSCSACFSFYKKWVSLEECARSALSEITTDQEGELWKSSRKVRLTASILSKVPKKASTAPDNFVNSCLHSNFRGNKYTEHGKLYEPVARAAYQQKTGREVTLCGTVVSATHPFLSASPDGLSGHDSILEIKCPAPGNCRKYIRETRDYDV